MSSVRVSVEGRRGCGYRQAGGLYLVAPVGSGRPCGLLPIPLVACPTCGHGIKYCRGWTWVNVAELASIANHECTMLSCRDCPLADATIGKAGLLWVGRQFYKTPHHFAAEAEEMGISRRIKSVPRGFKLAETWVALAHVAGICEDDPKKFALSDYDPTSTPAIFRLFKPTAIEYIVFGSETEEQLDAMRKRGIEPVRVERATSIKKEAA